MVTNIGNRISPKGSKFKPELEPLSVSSAIWDPMKQPSEIPQSSGWPTLLTRGAKSLGEDDYALIAYLEKPTPKPVLPYARQWPETQERFPKGPALASVALGVFISFSLIGYCCEETARSRHRQTMTAQSINLQLIDDSSKELYRSQHHYSWAFPCWTLVCQRSFVFFNT